MADLRYATLDAPTELNLGRVNSNLSTVRSTGAPQQTTIIDSLMTIGNSLAQNAVKAAKEEQFYKGQDRILQAALDGSQVEEYKAIQDEQPYFARLLGENAMVKGATEMASRVGAGKVFNEHMARLASGEDVGINPDVYRAQMLDQIKAQRTGDAAVDSVFIPQIMDKAQGLIKAQLSKHLEFNATNAMRDSVHETVDAVAAYTQGMQAESQDPTAQHIEGQPAELMTPVTKALYENVVKTLSPALKPPNVELEGWLVSKMALVVPAIERGDTSLYQAIKESGMYSQLDAKDIAKVEEARIKGKRENDSNNQLQFINTDIKLTDMVFNVSSPTDLQAIYQQALSNRQQYIAKGLEVPSEYQDDGIQNTMRTATGNLHRYDEKEKSRLRTELLARMKESRDNLKERQKEAQRLQEIAREKALIAGQARAETTSMLTNALGGSPDAPYWKTTEDGSQKLYQPTERDKLNSYTEVKGMLISMPPAEQKAALSKFGLRSMEDLAAKYNVVDVSVKGKLTAMLSASVGTGSVDAAPDNVNAIQELLNLKAVGDSKFVKAHIAEPAMQKNYDLFSKVYDATQNPSLAFSRSFGRTPDVKYKIDEKQFNKLAKSGDISDVVKAAGRFGPQAQAFIETEARDAVAQGIAKDLDEGFTIGIKSFQEQSEVVNDNVLINVPPASTLRRRTGITNSTTLEHALDFYASTKIAKDDKGYELMYDSGTDVHFIIPINADGEHLWNTRTPVDYKAVTGVIHNTKFSDTPLPQSVKNLNNVNLNNIK